MNHSKYFPKNSLNKLFEYFISTSFKKKKKTKWNFKYVLARLKEI